MIEILNYEFMRHAFMAGTLAAILAGAVGYFVVLRNLSFAGHALGHIGFAGASGAMLIGLSPFTGQLLLTLCAALGIGAMGERINKNDIAIGVVLAFSLGLGTLFLNFYHGYAGQATTILFGNLLGVTHGTLCGMTILTVASLIMLAILARPLLFSSLEPELAQAKGIPLTRLSILFLLLVAIAVTLASQAVGILLIFTLLIGPAAIAQKWTKGFWTGISVTMALSVTFIWLSLILAFYTDWPISFLISAIVFVLYLFT